MAERTHPVITYGVGPMFTAHLRNAASFLDQALAMVDRPIMHRYLEPVGEADTLADLREARARLTSILSDLDALPPKVEFSDEEG